MLESIKNPSKPPIFKPKRIAALTQLFKDKIEEVKRLQRADKLPYCKKIPKVIVRTSDIKIIMGVKERQAQRIMARVRVHAHKTTAQYITVEDFVNATHIPEDLVQRVLDICT